MNEVVNILIVDDNQHNLDTLQAILDNPGYRLLCATDADAALQLLLGNDVAAIVLDIQMPGVSGLELAQIIKGPKRYRQIPIVFLTAYLLDERDVLAGYDVGAVDYLTKPVNPQILRHKLAIYAELFRKTRALAHLNETLEARVQERTAELERSEAQLREANAQKDAFLATLAHELRNPMAPLRTGLDYLLRMPNMTPGATRTLGAMNRQLSHMVRLVDDLLDVARISRGVFTLNKEDADLRVAVEGAIEIIQPFLEQRRQTVAASVVPLRAEVDVTRVTQILGNLLHNAVKYSPMGSEIRIEMEHVDTAAVIRVIDKGAGIPKDQLGRVFEMFSRIDQKLAHAEGGLGIGLALARRLAELHGGTLEGQSAGEACGATFTLTLPGARAAAAPDAAAATTGAYSEASLRIVAIEDNTDAGETLVMWLEQLGHQISLAKTGEDGLELVRRLQPDLVFCDIGLPGMDGLEVCRRIKRLELATRPLVVALTGWGRESDRRRTEEAGFDHHLVKPVAADQLLKILHILRPC